MNIYLTENLELFRWHSHSAKTISPPQEVKTINFTAKFLSKDLNVGNNLAYDTHNTLSSLYG